MSAGAQSASSKWAPVNHEVGNGSCLLVKYLAVAPKIYAMLVRPGYEAAYFVTPAWFLPRRRSGPLSARLARPAHLRFEDVPGSYYDIQRGAVLHANDAFHCQRGEAHT